MPTSFSPTGPLAVVPASALTDLISLLHREGYQVVGPTIRDGYLTLAELSSAAELPQGWTTDTEAGVFRLRPRQDAAFFGFNLGQESWKKFLYPAGLPIVQAVREQDAISFRAYPQQIPAYALLGVRACEVAALDVLDRSLGQGQVSDPDYVARRQQALIIVVNCTEADASCFCASLGTGPAVSGNFDLALTELLDGDAPVFLIQAGSPAGERLLAALPGQPATAVQVEQARLAITAAAQVQSRSLEVSGLPGLLYDRSEHPHWQNIAARCLGCGNCALVCPTCFCFRMKEETDLANTTATRWREWEVCLNLDHSYIHGGWIRPSIRSRYRQWLTHKLAAWLDQFGCLGCTGCGRCLVWCPAAIDLTAELRALRQNPPQE